MSDIQLRILQRTVNVPAMPDVYGNNVTTTTLVDVLQYRTSNSNGIHWTEWTDVPRVREPSDEQ